MLGNFLSCGEWGYLLVCRLLTVVASLVLEGSRLSGSVVAVCGFSHTWAQLPQCMWDLPGPGIKPVSSAL